MLVAISGSQGSGKTTILEKLKEHGNSVVTRKSARTVLQELGVTLDELFETPENIPKFQERITEIKREDEKPYIYTPEVYFTERTHADVFTYSLIYLGRMNEHNEWLNQYYKTCLASNQYYNAVFYLRAGLFNVEHDGVRGSNRHYSRLVDMAMLDYTQRMVHPSKLNIIDTMDLDERVETILWQTANMAGELG